MKNYRQLAASFFAGVILTSFFFLWRESIVPEPPPPTCAALPPPKFSAKLPAILRIEHKTEVKATWEKVEGAVAYSVYLIDQYGSTVKKYSTPDTKIELKDVPSSGNLKLFVASVNCKNEDGEKTEGRPVKAKEANSILAPTLKKIIIED